MSIDTRFLIVAPARSGSTVLRTTLNSHPEIVCHGEVLGRNRILGFVRGPDSLAGEDLYRKRGESVIEFLQSEIYESPAGARASGFKALYYHFGELQFAEAIDHLVSSVDIKVVFLWRNDLVKRALSEIQHRMMAAANEKPRAASEAQVEQDCRNQLTCVSWLQKLFSRHDCIRVSYEELVADQKRILDEICDFLDVSQGRIGLPERKNEVCPTESEQAMSIV